MCIQRRESNLDILHYLRSLRIEGPTTGLGCLSVELEPGRSRVFRISVLMTASLEVESNLSFLRSQPLVSLCPIPLFPSTPSPPPQSTSLLSRLFHSICLRYIQFLPYISTAQFILYYAVVSKNKIQLGSVREPGKLSRGSRLSRPPK